MPTDDGGVLVVSGPPCAGKSAIARILAADLAWLGPGAVHIEVDSLFSLLMPRSDRGQADRSLAYDAAHATAAPPLSTRNGGAAAGRG